MPIIADPPALVAPAEPAGALANERQRVFEQRARAILATPELRDAVEKAREIALASRLANSDAARQTLDQFLAETAAYGALTAASEDPERPGLVWIQTPAREWMGHKVSGSRFAYDNPDNIYRFALIDDASTYTLDLRPTGPTGRLSVTIYQALTGAEVKDWEKQAVDAADDQRILYDSQGVARITIGPVDPQDGSLHLNSKGGRVVMVREALGDWHRQRPRAISVRRVAGPDNAGPTFAQRVATASNYTILGARTVAEFDELVYHLPTNAFAPSVRRAHGNKPSLIKMGLFHLADDEALVVDVLAQEAEYTSFSVTSPWMVSRNAVDRTGSRTSHQSHRNADGSYTYVVTRDDPGGANWIDTNGLLDGGIAMRWEGANAPEANPDDAVRSVRLVKRDALRSALPAGFPSVSPAERAAEIAARRKDYEARCGVPCRFIEN